MISRSVEFLRYRAVPFPGTFTRGEDKLLR